MSKSTYIMLATALSTTACGGGGSNATEERLAASRAIGEAYSQRLRDCGALSEGKTSDNSFFFVPKADPARYRDCLIACWDSDHATCMELIADACDSIRSDELSACTNHCTELKTDCENGKGQYKLTERCDGRTACDDLSDEAGCEEPWVYCDDARQQLPSSAVCDGAEHCADGSDERNCPVEETFVCKGGSATVLAYNQCDGKPDCPDGSDEGQDCATLTCDRPTASAHP